MKAKRTLSEVRFESYLSEHGYVFEHEPDLGVPKRPDYLISEAATGAHGVVEIKEFTTTRITERLHKGGGTAALSPKEVYGAVRGAVDAAARQLRDLAKQERPLVIALANPHFADVHLDVEHVLEALYGNPAYSIPIDRETGAAAGEGEHFLSRDGVLTVNHQFISAVLIVHERQLAQDWADAEIKKFDDAWDFLQHAVEARKRGEAPEGSRRFITVIHTIAAAQGKAVALPGEFFSGPDDRAWTFDAARGAYNCVRGEAE